jgi:hypothetical protein
MEQQYWLGRKRASAANARRAASAQARLAHLELAGRYSVKAAAVAPLPTGGADFYKRLETGARWLAARSAEGCEREGHLGNANRYARLRLDAEAAGRP